MPKTENQQINIKRGCNSQFWNENYWAICGINTLENGSLILCPRCKKLNALIEGVGVTPTNKTKIGEDKNAY